MSILKAILHHYNSTSKSYDTLHPETESAQITDWHKAVVNSLASTTLPAVVSALTTDSVMGKLMKLLLTASGVKYSIATNGYVCLGDYFGGLIIQWIVSKDERNTWPISFTKCIGVIPSLCADSEATESFVKSQYGYRGGIKFSETGFSTWYNRNSNGDVVYDVKMRFFGIGLN